MDATQKEMMYKLQCDNMNNYALQQIGKRKSPLERQVEQLEKEFRRQHAHILLGTPNYTFLLSQ
jgi:flagellar biosynthesis/type III secretory pathway chaperone